MGGETLGDLWCEDDFVARSGVLVLSVALVFFAPVDGRRRAGLSVFEEARSIPVLSFLFCRFLDFFGTVGLIAEYSVSAPKVIGK